MSAKSVHEAMHDIVRQEFPLKMRTERCLKQTRNLWESDKRNRMHADKGNSTKLMRGFEGKVSRAYADDNASSKLHPRHPVDKW